MQESGLAGLREQALLERREEVSTHIAKYQRRRTWATSIFVFVSLGLLAVQLIMREQLTDRTPTGNDHNQENPSMVVTLANRELSYTIFSLVFNGSIPLLFMWNYSVRLKSLGNELLDIDNQLDLIRIPDQSQEQKAQKLLQIQQFELKRYYDQTLRQSNGIFYMGVIAMVLGFLIVAWSMYFVSRNFSLSQGNATTGVERWTGESVIVAVLGAIGGILTNFVGAMYIKMFTEIVQAVTKSHASLVATSHLHLANVFAANIRSDQLREKTLADLALTLKLPSAGTSTDGTSNSSPL